MTQKARDVSHHLEESAFIAGSAQKRIVISVADGSAKQSSTNIPIKVQISPSKAHNKHHHKEQDTLDRPYSMQNEHIDEPHLLSSEKNNITNVSQADRSLPENFAIHIHLAQAEDLRDPILSQKKKQPANEPLVLRSKTQILKTGSDKKANLSLK